MFICVTEMCWCEPFLIGFSDTIMNMLNLEVYCFKLNFLDKLGGLALFYSIQELLLIIADSAVLEALQASLCFQMSETVSSSN